MSSIKPAERRFALIDCNNFYASCERVFNPKLNGKPVVVLSNNDGCVIARSQEVKDLGVPMGAPAFEYAKLFRENRVHVFSSNFALYGDMSHRVMESIRLFGTEMEVYSIDEAFVEISLIDAIPFCNKLRAAIEKWLGIPVSIGIGKTKTLAKAANRRAKTDKRFEGVCLLEDEKETREYLEQLLVEDVWGIGSRKSELLRKHRVKTAWDLVEADDDWIRKKLTVVGLRTANELRGISCLALEEAPTPKKSILCSRSFGHQVTQKEELIEAVINYTARAAEKLRMQKSVCGALAVMVRTNPFSRTAPYYSNQSQLILPQPTNYTPELIHYAREGVERIYCHGLEYKKAGVMLADIASESCYQRDLFVSEGPLDAKRLRAMELMDRINRMKGRRALWIASQGNTHTWKMRQDKVSQRYTTSWHELLQIRLV